MNNYSAKVFEEEDFDPRDYGYVLTPDIVNTKACYMLKEAEDKLMKKIKTSSDGTEVCFRHHKTYEFVREFASFHDFSLLRLI